MLVIYSKVNFIGMPHVKRIKGVLIDSILMMPYVFILFLDYCLMHKHDWNKNVELTVCFQKSINY